MVSGAYIPFDFARGMERADFLRFAQGRRDWRLGIRGRRRQTNPICRPGGKNHRGTENTEMDVNGILIRS